MTSRKTTCKAADVTAQTKTFQEKTWSPIVYENGQKAHTLTQERFEVIQDLNGFAEEEVRTETKKKKRKETHTRNVPTQPYTETKQTRKKKKKERRHESSKEKSKPCENDVSQGKPGS